ncbi:MAG: NFYB/HAP3 family transcription factor subunit [Candidatus Micrarchaeota archaeon]|nr:NFYB/HAP3 family transcription factor subunit [Candidatus Micrarchaeota archaeon]
MGNLSVASVERIIRAAGGSRVSREAAEALAVILEQKGMEIASKAAKLARHAGRKTITADDIRLAQ